MQEEEYMRLSTSQERGTAALYKLSNRQLISLSERRCVVIGSHPSCDLVLSGPSVAPRHVAIERAATGEISARVDKLTHAVSINGRRPARGASVPIATGSLVRVGDDEFVLTDAPGQAPTSAFGCLRGADPGFRHAIDTALRAATTSCSVLILGETGTGKELVARAVHEASPRSRGPMVSVNCGAISEQLIGSELFGHERGAFTGADSARQGMFVHASGGTLFLDELGELPLAQQPHLLRALENRTVRPVGSNREQPVDIRLVAATNRIDGLGGERSRLRADLYHRLATVVVLLPPLRQRRADIALLVHAFMEDFTREYGPRTIAHSTLRALCDYHWPGNIRELRAAVQRAMALCRRELTLDHLLPIPLADTAHALPPRRHARTAGTQMALPIEPTPTTLPPNSLPAHAPNPLGPPTLTRFEAMMRDQMVDALANHGSLRRAANALGMPKSTFADRAKRLGIPSARRRAVPDATPCQHDPAAHAAARFPTQSARGTRTRSDADAGSRIGSLPSAQRP
ncbi:MAG: hypothetical protein Tsb0020_47630 [Haliangiales bacterium]